MFEISVNDPDKKKEEMVVHGFCFILRIIINTDNCYGWAVLTSLTAGGRVTYSRDKFFSYKHIVIGLPIFFNSANL